jgi:uncharacterized protein (UPF0276 family)
MNPKNSGLSLREAHFKQFENHPQFTSAFEVIFEKYLFTEGERREILQDLSKNRFVHLHGVTSNIGSFDAVDLNLFKDLKQLADKTQAGLLSDHLCWTRLDQTSTFELLPVPRTKAMVDHIGQRVERIRDCLGQDFILENISSYFSFQIDEMSELDFMSQLHEKYQVRFLLDLNNLYVNSKNFSFSATEFLKQLPVDSVMAYHLGGHEDFGSFLFDTHGASVIDPVKDLFLQAEARFGEKPTFLERDENIPQDISVLTAELIQLCGGSL